jgi:hypothetical protein
MNSIAKILNGLEFLYPTNTIVSQLKHVFTKYPEYEKPICDAFSLGQLQSKSWAISELKKLDLDLGTVFLCAGWYATLALMIFESNIKVDKIRSFDIDPSVGNIAETFNKPWVLDNWKFKSATANILDINYVCYTYNVFRSNGTVCELTESPTTIINTSCEHIDNFNVWYNKIPNEKLVILQSNNYFEIAEHVNCSGSLEEFSNSCPMSTVLYQGKLDLPKYTRFMKIGYK